MPEGNTGPIRTVVEHLSDGQLLLACGHKVWRRRTADKRRRCPQCPPGTSLHDLWWRKPTPEITMSPNHRVVITSNERTDEPRSSQTRKEK